MRFSVERCAFGESVEVRALRCCVGARPGSWWSPGCGGPVRPRRRRRCRRFKFQPMHTSVHSWPTARSPRSRNWRKPSTDLMMPKVGSIVHLRSAYRARPASVCMRCRICSSAVAAAGSGAGACSQLGQRRIVRGPPARDGRLDAVREARGDIRPAAVAAIGEQRAGSAMAGVTAASCARPAPFPAGRWRAGSRAAPRSAGSPRRPRLARCRPARSACPPA